MSITVNCLGCKEEIQGKAALLFGLPGKNDRPKKDHLCKKCYREVKKFIRRMK